VTIRLAPSRANVYAVGNPARRRFGQERSWASCPQKNDASTAITMYVGSLSVAPVRLIKRRSCRTIAVTDACRRNRAVRAAVLHTGRSVSRREESNGLQPCQKEP
jgi:hypothetical protein